MTFRYFNLILVERKWTWIVTYDFARKANLISLLLGSGLKSIYHWKTHFLIIVASLFNSRSDLSSANIFLIDWIPSAKSLTYINKRSGPRTDPCETPERTLCLSLSLSVSLCLCLCLSLSPSLSKMELFVIIVNSFQSLTIITECSISDVAAVLDPPLCIILKSCEVEKPPGRKPVGQTGKSSFSIKY